MSYLGEYKQGTSATLVIGPFVDETNGKDTETALSIAASDVRISKNGGAFAAKNEATACSHMENGCYSCPVDTTDMGTHGNLAIVVLKAGALIVRHTLLVRPQNVHNSLVTNTGLLNVNFETVGGLTVTSSGGRVEVNTTHVAGSAISQASGVLNVNAVQFSGDATAADNAEAFFDGTGYAGGTIKLGVDTVAISGDTVAADNAEAMFDGNGYAGGTTKLDVNLVNWRGTQPNALVSNRVDVSVGAMAADVVTAAAIAPDAIGASELAAGAATEIAAAVHAFVSEVQGSYTTQQILSTLLSVCAGETENGGNTFLTPNGAATRVAATTNGSNERTAITLTPSA